MGILDWLKGGSKKKPRTKELGPERKPKEVVPEADRLETRHPVDEIIKELKQQLKEERRKSTSQRKQMRQMEDRFDDIQNQLVYFMEKQQDTVKGLATGGMGKKKVGTDVEESESEDDLKSKKKDIIRESIGEKVRTRKSLQNAVLKEKTFNNFVVDDSNRFAYLAAEAVATGQGRRYNPLFIYGPPGVGKTHLLHALANKMMERDPDLKVLYSSTERFTDEMVKSIEDDDIQGFRDRYRNIDVLLVDDIQMISGKETTQLEFFHMFNHLYNSGNQIVLCSDRPPGEIKELESRLKSRFEGGLIIDIKVPTFEGRRQILFNLAQRDGFSLSSEVLDYMSFYLDSNVRELEGGFNRVTAYAALMKEPITISLVRQVLEGVLLKREKMKRVETGEEIGLVKGYSEGTESDMVQTAKDMNLEEETDEIERELLSELRRQSNL